MIIGPSRTPLSVKVMIWITAVVSILSPILTLFVMQSMKMLGPGAWLALSYYGMMKGWLWQPLTYFFVHTVGIGISFGFLLGLFFNLFIMWFAGSEVAYRYGNRGFVWFYLTSGIVSGLVAMLALFLSGSQSILVGSGPAIFALLTAWAMIYPNMELFFLFVIRMKAKWLVLAILGFAFILNLANGAWIPFLGDLTGVIWALLIGHFVWKLSFPWKTD